MVCTRVAYSNNIAVTDPAKLAQEFTQPHYTPPAKKSLACRSEATRQIASKSRVRYVAAVAAGAILDLKFFAGQGRFLSGRALLGP